jgi:hypothetical protein
MTSLQVVLVVVGSLALAWAMTALMVRANRKERRSMERRRQAWIDSGADPDDKPNFFSGSGSGGGA